MTDNITKLAKTLNKRMQAVSKGKTATVAELGTVKSGGNLQIHSLEDVIPKDDYSVLKVAEIKDGSAREMKLEEGDVVVVIWADDEPVVIGKVEVED